MKLFTSVGGNLKLLKSDNSGKGYLSMILHLAPANLSGYEVCPNSSAGCRAGCLNKAGRGVYDNTQQARIKRTKILFENWELFKAQLITEINNFVKYCAKKNVKPAIRLNGTSDIAWESKLPELFTLFPTVQFYDYTKDPSRVGNTPKNYHLTFSRSETNEKDCLTILKRGFNVAVVFADAPQKWHNHKVFDADSDDLRFLDPKGVAALTPKGKAKRDVSGFVVK